MAKLPYMQFYPSDYQADVRCLSMATRGAWMEILCILWRAPKRGQRTLSAEEWARELGCLSSEFSLYLTDLKHHKIGKFLEENDGKITISSRRMLREDRVRRLAAARQQKQRDKPESRTESRSSHREVTGENQKSEIRNQKSYSEEEKKEERTTLSSSLKRDLDDESLRASLPKRDFRSEAREVLEFLNAKTGRRYRPVESTITMIAARLKGQSYDTAVDVQTCKSMIARKARDWLADEKMSKFLRPETLFNRTKFESYLGELIPCAVQNATSSCMPMSQDVTAGGESLRSL